MTTRVISSISHFEVGRYDTFNQFTKQRLIRHLHRQIWPRGYKKFSCSTQLSIKFILLINVKMLTIVGILKFNSRINDWPKVMI